ncbi:GAF domain-containing sensor histidine kinase [Myxococcus xanthus]|uniref:GAF domain-containing sensor histidine kinase n=1 Tax=Myxococcus xanthus TaxID=34 RepID=UPI0005B85718|nr:GAF domain-containing sensor histidine kinase [Myxococcus xanthus]QZZ54477.1 Adaptive-response sensory-kinase SasA [Myxococcus xanthus]UYI14114.1 ATP-binding protein [Myxococcus xanthus]UYI21481.1 ATP-binding protein [Myxococcus xanthus]SDW16726.1 PAS/PAC sensor signal transduction histidine kinase [Myxococcus xanthus]
MKTETRAVRIAGGPAPESFQALFEALDAPAAMCDPALRLVAVNDAFRRFCADQHVSVEEVARTLSGASVPADGASCDVELLPDLPGVVLTLSRRGDVVAVRARNEPELSRNRLVVAERALLEQARTEGVLLDLGRSVAEAGGEEELVAAVARGVKELFPGRSFCIRITDSRTGGLTSLYAEGRLKEGAHEPLVLMERAVEKTSLDRASLPVDRVAVLGEVPLLFQDSTHGVSAPLVASGQLFGAINMEYPADFVSDVPHDERVLLQLANQVAVAVKNAKLIDELTFVRKYLEDLLEKANALILVANRDKQVVVFNQALSALTGFGKEEVLGRDFFWLIPESEHLRLNQLIAAAIRGEPVNSFETRLLTSSGAEVRVSFATSSKLSQHGEVEGVIAIGQDITVVKELEKRIIHAEKLASIGQLAASVVHEINNPMTAVATYADALLQRSRMTPGANPADQEKLRKILESSHRILRFTRDLVSYARPAQDRPERVQLNAIVDMAVGFCEHVVAQARVTIQREYIELPPLSAVRANLVQVFVNLITNACHAMPPGGSVILATGRDGQDAVVKVRDTGTGIEPKHLQRIFEPFFTTKPEGRGTGLGLSICQGIVENHGGRLTVESTMGEGTTFIVRLPLQQG